MKIFHTSESHENQYKEVLGHDEHEFGLRFIITIIYSHYSPCTFIVHFLEWHYSLSYIYQAVSLLLFLLIYFLYIKMVLAKGKQKYVKRIPLVARSYIEDNRRNKGMGWRSNQYEKCREYITLLSSTPCLFIGVYRGGASQTPYFVSLPFTEKK